MGHNLIVKSYLLLKIICSITQDIEHVEQNFQVVTYSIIYTGHIQNNHHEVINVIYPPNFHGCQI